MKCKSTFRNLLLYILLLTFSLSACMKKNNDPYTCNYDPCELKAPESEVKALEAFLLSKNITATKHCSGLYYEILNPGADVSPAVCSAIAVTYKGTLTDGTVFDQSTTPRTFSLITLIEGWKKGLLQLKKGGKIRLYVPPSLGYGSTTSGAIPGNSILLFDIDLLDLR
jgi:FKBP-type peptidyl-prolyl cis-trans isomerase FkpA